MSETETTVGSVLADAEAPPVKITFHAIDRFHAMAWIFSQLSTVSLGMRTALVYTLDHLEHRGPVEVQIAGEEFVVLPFDFVTP